MKNILFLSYLVLPDERPQSFLLSKIIKQLKKDKKYNINLLTYTKVNKLIKKKNFYRYSLENKFDNFLKKFAFFKYLQILFPGFFYEDLINKINYIIEKKKINLIISFSNPYYLNSVANYIYKKKGKKFFSHYSDPLIDSSYNKINFTFKLFLKKLEKSILKNSEKIIFCNNNLKNFVLSKHENNLSKKAVIIPHFFEFKKNKKKKIKENKKTVFAYFGSFYGPRQPNDLIKAVMELNKDIPGFKESNFFEFYGSDQLSIYKKEKIKHIPKNVVFKKRVAQKKLSKIINKVDYLISIDGKNIENIYLPSKIIEYFQFKKPILAISSIGSPSYHLSRKIDITFANINNIRDIKNKILKIKKKKNFKINKNIKYFSLKNIIKLWKKEIN